MPVHSAMQGDDPAAALTALVEKAEKARETVIQVKEIGNNWIVVTNPAPRAPQNKTRTATR